MKPGTPALLIGLVLTFGAIGLVIAIVLLNLTGEIAQVLLVFAGMFAAAALNAFANLIGEPQSAKPQILFNEEVTRLALEAVPITYERVNDEASRPASWEPTPEDLLLQDRSLALAKLRIDLERELRRIARKIDLKVRPPVGLSQLTRLLKDKGTISAPIVSAIEDVLPACNLAIHGAEVSMETAQAVLGVGADVVSALQRLPETAKDPQAASPPLGSN